MITTEQIIPDPTPEPQLEAPANVEATVGTDGERTIGRATVTPPADGSLPKAPAPQGPARPDWIPEKFWKGSVEESSKAMSQSYGELEKAFHAKGQPKTTAPSAAAPAVPAGGEALTLDAPDVAEELTAKGALSAETYARLAKSGLSKTAVDMFLAGQQALAQGIRAELAAVAGGDQQLTDTLAWAKDNATPEQIAAYEAARNSGSKELVKFALGGLVAAQRAAVGAEPRSVSGEPQGGTAGGVRPFASNYEMVQAMNDPRYERDAAFRAQVDARVMAAR